MTNPPIASRRAVVANVLPVTAAAVMLAAAPSAHAAIRTCLPIEIGRERIAATAVEGKRLALAAWVEQVRTRHGEPFAGWTIAIEKTLACRRGATSGGGAFTCQARAAPCTIRQVPPNGIPIRPPGPARGKGLDA